jgi:hypothetical protein
VLANDRHAIVLARHQFTLKGSAQDCQTAHVMSFEMVGWLDVLNSRVIQLPSTMAGVTRRAKLSALSMCVLEVCSAGKNRWGMHLVKMPRVRSELTLLSVLSARLNVFEPSLCQNQSRLIPLLRERSILPPRNAETRLA